MTKLNEYHIKDTVRTSDGITVHLARERRQITGRFDYYIDFACLPTVMDVSEKLINQAIKWHMPLRAAYGVSMLPDNTRIRLFKLSAIKELIISLGAEIKQPQEALAICNTAENYVKERGK
ncbi:hypothetical protein EH198_21420 [Paenibacillus rhizophilus]|uniref:Uncharacterized protein n=1 Tax=Paenibacillus rhizophilus TaxID=1850366 RepID=A0A3N9NYI4_9BACL|nr:hypothetical protein EH198_21420 [Paenibacillus rhizophilus]